jgi:hypothetical protein
VTEPPAIANRADALAGAAAVLLFLFAGSVMLWAR